MSNVSNSLVQVSPGALVSVKDEHGNDREAIMISPVVINIPDQSEVEVMFLDQNISSEPSKKD